MYDEKLTSRVFRLYSHKLHKQRLNMIKTKVSSRINNSVPRTLKYQNLKRTGYASQLKERMSHIQRENMKIYQVMNEISSGKRYNSLTTSNKVPPISLNYNFRKKEAQRIIDDNQALAKRLNGSSLGVSFKKFDEDWQNTSKYMTAISKKNIRKLPRLDDGINNLPFIRTPDFYSKKSITNRSPVSNFRQRNQSLIGSSIITPLTLSKLDDRNSGNLNQDIGKINELSRRSLDKKEEFYESHEYESDRNTNFDRDFGGDFNHHKTIPEDEPEINGVGDEDIIDSRYVLEENKELAEIPENNLEDQEIKVEQQENHLELQGIHLEHEIGPPDISENDFGDIKEPKPELIEKNNEEGVET
jgi:Hemingway/CFA97